MPAAPASTLLDGGAGTDTAVLTRLTPIAYWSLNETSGTTIGDSAGTPQNGKFYGAHPTSTMRASAGLGRRRSARRPARTSTTRPGTTSRSPHDAAFEVAQGTIQLWFNTRDANDKQTLFAKDRDGNGAGQLLIWIDDRDLKVEARDRQHDARPAPPTTSCQSNIWYQMTFTFGPAAA